MNASLSDASGVLVATVIGVPVIVLPGYALGMASGVLGFRDLAPGRRLLCAALLGIGLLPFLDSALAALVGVPATALISLALAPATLVSMCRTPRGRIDRQACALMALWLAVLTYALIDFDTGETLHLPISVTDLVKHAGLTRSIVESGVPPLDPFFARSERVGYYFYFYTPCALVDWLGGTLVSARAAFAGVAFWTGIGLLGLIERVLAASGLVRGAPPGLVRAAVLLLVPAGSLDILLVLEARFGTGIWVPAPEWMNEQVVWWPASLVWVPHHVAGAMACWLGLLVLAEVADGDRPGRAAERGAVAVAGTAFAACAGLSVWVSIGAVTAAGLWMTTLGLRRRWRDAGRLAAAGLFGLALAAPYLLGLLANREGAGSAIVFEVRRFGPIEGMLDRPAMPLLRLALLPLNYYLCFGVFASGTILFWRSVVRSEAHAREAGRLLTVCAAAGLIVGGCLRSAIINNDLGWRVVLVAQIPAFVWTVAALARLGGTIERRATPVRGGAPSREGQAPPSPAGRSEAVPGTAGTPAPHPVRLRFPATIAALLVVGYVTSVYGFAGMRTYPTSGAPNVAFLGARPDIDRDLRAAYVWAGDHLPADMVLQQDPSVRRALGFGLYGRQQVAVADKDARLFGASAAAVEARLARVAPIFSGGLNLAELRRRAAEAGIGALVVTAQDAAWADPGSWVWRAKAAYAGPLVRIVRVEDLDG